MSRPVLPARRNRITPPSRRIVTALGAAAAAVTATGWLGLRARPAPFSAVPQPPAPPETVPLPAGLREPVERFYRQNYGEQVPVICSAVLSGRGTLRLNGITFPMRFRFIHEAARNFRAYFELNVFGVPVMKVNEH